MVTINYDVMRKEERAREEIFNLMNEIYDNQKTQMELSRDSRKVHVYDINDNGVLSTLHATRGMSIQIIGFNPRKINETRVIIENKLNIKLIEQ